MLESIRRVLLTTEKVVYQAVAVYSSFTVIGVANRRPDLNLNCGAMEVGLNVVRVVRGAGHICLSTGPGWTRLNGPNGPDGTVETRRPPVDEWCCQEQQLLTDRLLSQHRSRTMVPPRFEEPWLLSGPDRRYAARP